MTGDYSPANSEEYDAIMKEYEAELTSEEPVNHQPTMHQVFMATDGGGNNIQDA